MKQYRFILAILLLCSGIGAWADNIITLSDVKGAAGTEVTVSISLTNNDAVSAMQLSIPLGDDLTFVANSQQAGNRTSGHSLSAGVKDGVLNVMVYSNTMATMSGNEGEVCSIKLLLGNNPGTISLNPSKAALTGADGSSLAVTVSAGTVDIRGAKAKINSTISFGKVAINETSRQSVWIQNVGNEPLVITDISFSSTVFSTPTELPKVIDVGVSTWIDVNCTPTVRGDIDEEMTIISNSVSGNSSVRLTATPYAVNELRLVDALGTTGEEVTIGVTMKNMDDITGLQMEINIPDGLEYVDGSFVLSSRKQEHSVSAYVAEGVLYVVAYSSTDKPFTGSDGEVGSFKVKIVGSDNAYLNIDKALLTSNIDGKVTNVLSATYGCSVSVKSPSMYASSSLDFGRIPLGQEHVQESFTIWNFGSAPLTISDITFGNGLFSVKEQLPITIDPSSRKDITVMCEAEEDGDISTDMEIYTNDPQKRLFVVKITGSIYTPDYLTAVVNASSDEVNLNVSLSNYSDIYGIQFDIVTPEIFAASADDITLSERGNSLSASVNAISNGVIRVMAYVKNNQFISSGDGKVMTIKMTPKERLEYGDYTLTLKNIMLGSKDLRNIYAGKDVTITYGVRAFGDANGDGKVDINDAVCIMNYLVGKLNTTFVFGAADVDGDGEITVADAVGVVNIIMNP